MKNYPTILVFIFLLLNIGITYLFQNYLPKPNIFDSDVSYFLLYLLSFSMTILALLCGYIIYQISKVFIKNLISEFKDLLRKMDSKKNE